MRTFMALSTLLATITAPLLVSAATISINPNLPGVEGATDLVSIIVNIYQTALLVGAFLAFGSIVYGAVTYALAEAGFAKSEARERITNAVIGLLLLAAAYLLLYTINPALTILTNPGLEEVAVIKDGTAGSGGSSGGGNGTVTSGQKCDTKRVNGKATECKPSASCSELCTSASDIVTHCNDSVAVVDNSIINGLKCLKDKGFPELKLTETDACPPSGTHAHPGHQNGCAADFAITGSNGNICDYILKLREKGKECGIDVVGEYVGSCAGKQWAGCKYENTTGNHIHINGCGNTNKSCPT